MAQGKATTDGGTEEARAARARGLPIWRQIRDQLAAEIAEGRWAAGERLPSEHALARRFGVNRHTLRRAVADLAEEGMLHVRRGAGATVTEGRIDYRFGARQRFSQNLAAAGRAHGRTLLGLETVSAGRAEALALDLPHGAKVLAVETLAEADGAPVIHSRMTFPAELSAMIPALEGGAGISEALEAAGVRDYARVWTRLSAGRPGALIARHLRMQDGAAALFAESLNRGGDGRPVEYARSWFCTDRMSVLTGTEDPPAGL